MVAIFKNGSATAEPRNVRYGDLRKVCVHYFGEPRRSGGSHEVFKTVPQPVSERAYSGKFNLGVGEPLHRQLALRAAEEQLSLNQYVVRRLTTEG